MKISDNVAKFVVAVRGMMQQDTQYMPVTRKTEQKLIIEITKRLKNKASRKDVLRAITGLFQIQSQSDLTQHTQCVIIDMIQEGRFDNEIKQIEYYVTTFAKAGLDVFKIGIFPDGELPDMPPLFEGY